MRKGKKREWSFVGGQHMSERKKRAEKEKEGERKRYSWRVMCEGKLRLDLLTVR